MLLFESIYDDMLKKLKSEGGYVLNEAEKLKRLCRQNLGKIFVTDVGQKNIKTVACLIRAHGTAETVR